MYDHALFVKTVATFSGRLLESYDSDIDVDAVLRDLMGSFVAIFDLAGAGMGLAEDGTMRTTTGVPEQISALEDVQHQHQVGPCMAAFREGRVVVVDDLTAYADRWPAYAAVAARLGMTTVVGLPLQLAGHQVGAVNLYSGEHRDWPAEDLEAAQVLADLITGYLVTGSKLRQQEQLTEQLQHALDARTVIEQAKGVVAASNGVGVDEAFELIRRHARTHHVTVRELSEAIVELGLRL